MKTPIDATVIGETLWDMISHVGGDVLARPGGSPLNLAIGLGRLGHSTVLDTWIGQDGPGLAIKAHLDQSHVRLAPGAMKAERTSTATIVFDESGHSEYSFDMLWEIPPLPDELIGQLVHTGSLGAVFEPGADRIHAMLQAVRDRSTITYDPNIRWHVMGKQKNLCQLVERLVATADLVKASAEDLEYLYPRRAAQASADAWLRLGPELVVLTRAELGAQAIRLRDGRPNRIDVPADRAGPVVDTVGAGDSFMAGLIHGLCQRGLIGAAHRGELGELDEAAVAELLSTAAKAAAVTVSRVGADPPWLAELSA